MHMADALVSPAVGGSMWAVAAGAIAYCSRKVRAEPDSRKVPLMGVLGAFLFAAQMINFSIPMTGSSGHLGGGILLSVLLGPHAAFLTITSVLVVQALFFADGGLLALGCNIVNIGAVPAFIAYPLIYRTIAGTEPTRLRLKVGVTVAAIAGLQLGAFGVVLETVVSGISSLPFSTFVAFMQPIHLAIGIVEGVVTAAVVSVVYTARPELVRNSSDVTPMGSIPLRAVTLAFLAAAVLTGGLLSRFASADPDGLEWSIARVTGEEPNSGRNQGLPGLLSQVQRDVAVLPGYAFRKPSASIAGERGSETGVAGIVGGGITLIVALFVGVLLKRRASAG